jgi:hypothetical protein
MSPCEKDIQNYSSILASKFNMSLRMALERHEAAKRPILAGNQTTR